MGKDEGLRLGDAKFEMVLFICILYLFIYLLASSLGLRELSSRTRDQTRPSAVKSQSPNHWTARELPEMVLDIQGKLSREELDLGGGRQGEGSGSRYLFGCHHGMDTVRSG